MAGGAGRAAAPPQRAADAARLDPAPAGEAPYEIDPADHDPVARAALDPGTTQVLLSLSAPLGIESLPADEAAPLLDAWHAGALALR